MSPARSVAARSATASFDADAIARAERALRALSINFQDWMTSEVDRLEAARAEAHRHGFNERAAEALYMRAHDVKGLGSTYDYPLVTAIAAQLCRLLDSPDARTGAREAPALVDAHVDAIRAIVRSRLRGSEDPTGCALVEELRTRVDRWVRPEQI